MQIDSFLDLFMMTTTTEMHDGPKMGAQKQQQQQKCTMVRKVVHFETKDTHTLTNFLVSSACTQPSRPSGWPSQPQPDGWGWDGRAMGTHSPFKAPYTCDSFLDQFMIAL